MGKKDANKPRGKMSSYAFFVQTCREEHKKKHPGEQVVFAEFSRKCAEKWKAMGPKEKKRFEDMAAKDKTRYDREMVNYVPSEDAVQKGGRKRKQKKDPNAPKRALSAFFFFCAEQRPDVRKVFPNYGVGDIAKEMGKRWEGCTNKPKFDELAKKDKVRYEKELTAYKASGMAPVTAATKRAKPEKAPPKKVVPVVEEEDDEDDEDDDDEEEEEDEDDDDEEEEDDE